MSGKIGSASPGSFTIVGTPIGNLGDLSPRGQAALAAADVIYCEDTRVTGKLCAHFGIKTPCRAYHEHNAEALRPRILEALNAGQAVALVSDAGMPLISDPGYKLVQAVIAEGLEPQVVPGPTAATTALVLAGLPSDRFMFAGFLPPKSGARRKALSELAQVPGSLIFYEGPSRLAAMLADAGEALGNRPAAVSRELTKLYEETRRGRLAELAQHYAEAGPPKGEIVVLIGPPAGGDEPSEDELDAMLRRALAENSLKDAVAYVTNVSGTKKKLVYERALKIKDESR
jgi:16S rRNA (cytidine1402-2'-O)-methyltransferase